jgi:hypothetical protein
MRHRRRKLLEHSFRGDWLTGNRREVGCLIRRIRGMQATVHANAGGAGQAAVRQTGALQ